MPRCKTRPRTVALRSHSLFYSFAVVVHSLSFSLSLSRLFPFFFLDVLSASSFRSPYAIVRDSSPAVANPRRLESPTISLALSRAQTAAQLPASTAFSHLSFSTVLFVTLIYLPVHFKRA